MQVEDQSSVLGKLYHQVRTAMLNVDESKGSRAAVDGCIRVADDWYS